MSDEFNMDNPTPTLTFEPFGAETKQEIVVEPEAEKPVVEEPSLTPEEQKMVDDFAKQIELSNSNMILQYGAGAQKKIADFSETALNNVK